MKKTGVLDLFNDELNSYPNLRHSEMVPVAECENKSFYLPIQDVVKMGSTTTKVRPVFDGSAKSTSGHCINDLYLTGPNLYPLTSDILLKFRCKAIGMTADVGKMYRQVKLADCDKGNHRYITRDGNGNLVTMRMTRVTFGIKPSLVATAVIRHHATKYMDKFPAAHIEIIQSFYVDDFVSGSNSGQEAKELCSQLCELFLDAGMVLRKWRCSSPAVMDAVPDELKDRESEAGSHSLKALGIHWDTNQYELFVATPEVNQMGIITKRDVAKAGASIYDVLGLLSPWTISGRIVLQKLCPEKTKWDEQIPAAFQQQWECWLGDMTEIKNLPIKRFTQPVIDKSSIICGFCDSSNNAYAAVLYLRNNDGTTNLIFAKARVCPVKSRTLPELELESAKLLAQMTAHVANILAIPLSQCKCWTDSVIVLA